MFTYIQNRIGEHSTQLALSADFTALLATLGGQADWHTFAVVVVGSLPAILFPSK
jgi:hypothetical protein